MASYCSWKTVVLLCFVTLVVHRATAREFTVGGKAGWLPPAFGSGTYNDWAERNRFLIGDTLVFKYNPSEDSVAQVSAEDYNSCSTSNPIGSYKDGNTVFRIPHSGPFYFITANSTNCHKGQKLIVVVLVPRNARPSLSPAPPPASNVPSPTPTTAFSPSAAPSSAVPTPAPITAPTPTIASPVPAATVPSPVPTTALSPSPAPTATVDSPAPASVSVPFVSPIAAPVNTSPSAAPVNTSPSATPIESQGGGVPSASAPAATASCFVYAAAIIGTLTFSLKT